ADRHGPCKAAGNALRGLAGGLMFRHDPAAWSPQSMTQMIKRLATTVAVTLLAGWGAAPAVSQTAKPQTELAAHRAVYDLKLATSRSKSTVSARGRILYDFTGSVCEGYKLEFRQVSEIDNGEGKQTLSDLRSTTWEGGDAKDYTFKSQNYLNQ